MAMNVEPFLGACFDCVMMCARQHGGMSSLGRSAPKLRPPCFYKVVGESSVEGAGPSSSWMRVPTAFVHKYMPHVNRKRMVLENAEGRTWPVVYSAEQGFFTGWDAFAAANKLAVDDALFFSFVDETKFVVLVFGTSGCEKRVTSPHIANSTQVVRDYVTGCSSAPKSAPVQVVTQSVLHPAPSLGRSKSLSIAPSVTRSSERPDRGCEWPNFGFRTPVPSISHNGTVYEPPYHDTTAQTDPINSGWPHSITDNFRAQSAPSPRRSHAPRPFWEHGKAGPRACPSMKLARGDGDDSRGETSKLPTWGRTLTKIQARAVVTKAILRKINTSPLPMMKQCSFRSNRLNSSSKEKIRKRAFTEILGSDGEFGSDAGSAFGGCRHGKRERTWRSLSLDRWEDGNAGRRANFALYGNVEPTRFKGGPSRPSRHGEMGSSFDDIGPEYVPLRPRKPGRPQKHPPSGTAPQRTGCTGSSDQVSDKLGQTTAAVGEKRKRGRPFKHQIPGSDVTEKPLREIFVSRRRKVTQSEREDALNAAYKWASHLKSSTTFVVVMRQSFVYRNFVLGVPRRFANRYMPDSNREVMLVDAAWHAWFCTWNGGYNYMAGRGWRNFALEHCLEEDDALLMEILEETEARLTIKVHIFPVVAIPPGLSGWTSHVCPENSFNDSPSGVRIEPMLHPRAKIRPHLPPSRTHRRTKRVKREPRAPSSESEDSITSSDDVNSSSSDELD